MVKHNLSAGYGIISWLIQRVTAVIMLLIFLMLGVFFVIAKLNFDQGFNVWQHFFSCTLTKTIVQILVLSIVIHAWIGMRDLWMDYVKNLGLKIFLYGATILWLIGSFIYSVKILWF